MASLENTVIPLDLQWSQSDVFQHSFEVNGVDWSGSYTAWVEGIYGETEIDVTASVVVDVTTFLLEITAGTSAEIPVGVHEWYCKSDTEGVRARGKVIVRSGGSFSG